RPILPPGEPDSRHDGRENQDDRYTRPRPADPLPLPESPPASGHGYTRKIRDLKQAIAEPATYLAAGCQARDLDRTAAFWTGKRPIHAAILRRFLIRMKLRRGVGAETSRISGLTRSLQSVASDGHHQSGRADMQDEERASELGKRLEDRLRERHAPCTGPSARYRRRRASVRTGDGSTGRTGTPRGVRRLGASR